MTATATPTADLTMEIVLDTADHRHLRFRRGPIDWELLTFPGGLVIRGRKDYVLVNGADDVIGSMAFTAGDPVYWAEKLTSGSPRVWDEDAFRTYLSEEAEALEDEERVRELLAEEDFGSEALAREVLAGAGVPGLYLPDDTGDFYALDEHFLRALERAREGLAFYADQS